MQTTVRIYLLAGLIFLVGSLSAAPVLTFELGEVSGVTPAGNMVISDQYQASHGISFSSASSSVVIAERNNGAAYIFAGPSRNGNSFNQPSDTAIGAVGDFYLGASNSQGPITMHFANPVANASGVIIDLQGSQFADFQAFDAQNNLLSSFRRDASHTDGTDGAAADWSFNAGDTIIDHITVDGSCCWALDNITSDLNVNDTNAISDPGPIPEPSSFLLLVAAGSLVFMRNFFKA